jgi:type II secretory pathway component PulK
VILGYQVRQKLSLVQRLEERAKLRYLCDAGVKIYIANVRSMKAKGYYPAEVNLGNNTGLFKEIAVGDARVSICYNHHEEISAPLRYGIVDEESKINLNTAGVEILERLFRVVLGENETDPQELSAAVIDWRDEDNLLSHPGSAEDAYYKSQEHPYVAKNAPFESIREPLLIKGMNEDKFLKLQDYITVYSEGAVNINTASRVVLLALGLSSELVDRMLSYRNGEDGLAGTADDAVFEEISDIVPKLKEAFRLSDEDIASLDLASGEYLAVDSNNFMIRAEASLNNRKNKSQAICVTNRQGRILYWQES